MLQILLISLLIAPQVLSNPAFTNISIDDSSLDPLTGARITYGYLNQVTANGSGWHVGQNCSTCLARPDPSQVFGGTWHDTSTVVVGNRIPFASVSFTGVAIYVMGIVVSSAPESTTSLNNSRIFFQVDGADEASFMFNASLGSEVIYSYNTTLFAKEDLSDGLHNVTMMCGSGDPSTDSVCLLDRFIYTTSTNPQANASSPALNSNATVSTGVIVGAAMGSSLFLILLVALYFLRRRHSREQDTLAQTVVPFMKSYVIHPNNDSEHSTEPSNDVNTRRANAELPRYSDIILAGHIILASDPLYDGGGGISPPRRQRARMKEERGVRRGE
ncbi:hypothetical protein SCHPADRAFT_609133 [Schizopora paradoxa]|uniref:Uncharacterized protein n=1 Tax=Schizopora paradoxa TaxID=27342 RepID=A0A0H2RUE4_9AGAM|nr:hypothetical protein SCHPADRAFT_609133 [Schizopora paradoxa]